MTKSSAGSKTTGGFQGFPPGAMQFWLELASEGEAYLDGIYTKYVMTPVATVGVGYRFF